MGLANNGLGLKVTHFIVGFVGIFLFAKPNVTIKIFIPRSSRVPGVPTGTKITCFKNRNGRYKIWKGWKKAIHLTWDKSVSLDRHIQCPRRTETKAKVNIRPLLNKNEYKKRRLEPRTLARPRPRIFNLHITIWLGLFKYTYCM